MGALVTRRRFFAATLAAAGLLATAGLTLRLGAPARGAALLGEHELDIVRAVAEAMFPADPMPIDGLDAQVGREVDRLAAELLDGTRRSGFRYVLRALEMGTQASRGRRFTRLPVEDRREILDVWADASVMPRRLGLDVLKVMLGMAYFRHPAVIEHIGWRTGCAGGAA